MSDGLAMLLAGYILGFCTSPLWLVTRCIWHRMRDRER